MLRNLSYLNLIIAVCYFLAYLQNGGPLVICGLLSVVVYNWMILRDLEREQFKPGFLQWGLGAISLCFALYIGYGGLRLLLDAVDYQYFPLATILLIGAGWMFVLCIIWHLFVSFIKFL